MIKALFAPILACAFAAGSASAQTSVSVGAARPSGPAVQISPINAAPGGANLVSPLSSLGLSAVLAAPSISPTLAVQPAVMSAARTTALAASVQPAAAIAAKPEAAKPVAAHAAAAHAAAPTFAPSESAALSVLSAASVGEKKSATMESALDPMFDGSTPRDGDVAAVAAPAAKPVRSFLGRAALAAGVFLATPGMALAAQAPSVVEPSAMALVGDYAPLATAIAAVLGALVGLWSARSKDGSPANAGQVFSGALSHGAIAGAAAFTLLDLTKVAFLGTTAAALTPLTAAVATAALAQAAFAAKFMDPATTPADRIIGAFPAVAMAFGLSVGAAAFLPAATMLTIGTAAMMATGAATALFTAIFRLEKSPAGGPAMMGRGFVLQALMTGLAIALGPSPYALFFFLLGLAGFASVMYATGKEVWAALKSLKNTPKPGA